MAQDFSVEFEESEGFNVNFESDFRVTFQQQTPFNVSFQSTDQFAVEIAEGVVDSSDSQEFEIDFEPVEPITINVTVDDQFAVELSAVEPFTSTFENTPEFSVAFASVGGFGTAVEANPVGEATAELATVLIKDVIYSIPGDGSSTGGGGNATFLPLDDPAVPTENEQRFDEQGRIYIYFNNSFFLENNNSPQEDVNAPTEVSGVVIDLRGDQPLAVSDFPNGIRIGGA